MILSNINFNINKKNYNFFTELLKNDFSNLNLKLRIVIFFIVILRMMFYLLIKLIN